MLIEHGANVNATDDNRHTALAECVGSGNAEIVQVLLAASAKPDPSALSLASWLGRIDFVEILLHAGADPNAGIVDAARGGHVEILVLLLDKGANVNAKSEDGSTALHTGARCRAALPPCSSS